MSLHPLAPRIGSIVRYHVEETDGNNQWRLDDQGFNSQAEARARYNDLNEIRNMYKLPNRLRIVKTTLTSEVVLLAR